MQLRILQLNGLSPELWSLLASPHRCWAPLGLCVFHFPRPRRRPKKLHLREPRSLRAAPGLLQLRFMHHRFNKHRQHPHRSPLPILPAKGTKLFPLLSSPPNPRLYQLSIKKIQLQFGIRQNTLITKGWCNLITWYLFRGLSRGLTHIERGWKGQRKKAMQGKCQNKPSLLCCEGHICWMAFLHNLTEPVCACAEERRGGGISVRAFAGPLTARTSDVVEIKNG